MSKSEHFVQFYETDSHLLSSLSSFITSGLGAGDACIVVATKTHRQGLEERLQANGLDIVAARACGQYVSLDADETLSKFMEDGSPVPERFVEVIGSSITQAAEGERNVRVFGEMVAILFAEGNYEAVIDLEALWNRMGKSHAFLLYCAYPIDIFAGAGHTPELNLICAEHSSVIPAESYTALTNPDDRLRAIAVLQQRAKSLETKIAEGKEVEEQLRVSEVRYRRLFESSSDGVLIVDPDTHKIADVNPALTQLLAVTQEDLLGKELWEIGLLKNQEDNLKFWQELYENRIVRYEHLPIHSKDGKPLDIEFVSSFYQTNGHRIIQCSVRNITERRGTEEVRLHLASIVESSDDAIISKSLEGIILSWNKGAEQIFGYSAEEAIGKPIVMLMPPDRVDEEPKILERLKRGERIDHYETVRVTKSGRTINVSLTVSPIKDSKGKIIAASKVARDITERKQAEQRLREQAEIIETLNRTGQILSAELDLQRVAQVVTQASTELIGARFGAFFYNVIDNKGQSSMQYQLCGVPREMLAHFQGLQNTDLLGLAFRDQESLRIADVTKDKSYGKNSPYYGIGNHLPVISYLAVPVISRSGTILGGLFFGHPMEGAFAERHEQIVQGLAAQAAISMDNAQLYELSQRDRVKAEAANRSKDEFLATVSHELRTPLNAILGWSDLLSKGNLDSASAKRAIDTIARNAKSQAQLIEDILDVSRAITGKFRLTVGPVDLTTVIKAAIDSTQLAADAKGIQIQVICDPFIHPIMGDASRLQQVIWNLLSNAIKFTPTGGRIEVRLESAGSNLRVAISDTGQGISKDLLPFIFERFRQADSTTTRRYGGLGLGLAIVRHLVELHGGTVHAHSEGEGSGATFTLNLPLAHASSNLRKQNGEIEDSSRNEDQNRHLKSLPSLAGVQVLLVDDDRDNLHILTLMLTNSGARVQATHSAAIALEILQWYQPDVVVSDLAMPEEDGYSLISKIRALEAQSGKASLAVALTAYVRIEDRARAIAAGFDGFISKPVAPNEVITEIANLIESMDRQIGWPTKV
jgi:PAS domain S-box-containing protein